MTRVSPDRLLRLPFDHYERYSITAEIVSILWPLVDRPRRLRILDVGGHSSSLKLFLPEDEVVLADPKEPPRFTHREGIPFVHDGYVVALGGRLPFPDNSFDLVTAHDTLEHVPAEARREFIDDLVRLSRRFVILHGPVHHPDVVAGEERMARFWQAALDWEHHPLEEHLDLGLPDREFIEGVLRGSGLEFAAVPNGNVLVWLSMMALEGYALALPDPGRLDEQLARSFNRFVAPRDFGEPCYRVAFVAALDPDDQPALDRIRTAFAGRVEQLSLIDDATTVETAVRTLEWHARQVRREDEGFQRRIAALELLIEERDVGVAERDQRILGLQDQRRDLDRHLRDVHGEYQRQIVLLEDERRQLSEDLRYQADELERILESAGYRLFRGVGLRLRRWFPRGTLRGRALGAVRRLLYRMLGRRKRSEPEQPIPGPVPAQSEAEEVSPLEREDASWAPPPATPDEYQRWIDRCEPTPEELEHQRLLAASLSHRPLISILTPLWNPTPERLRETIESVRAQTYDRWELCIGDGGSSQQVRALLEELQKADRRIRVTVLDENQGIAGNTNEAMDLARGEYVAFLDQTDLLAPFALFRVAEALNKDPGIDVLSSDWDLLSEDGRARFNPLFTPEWSPDLLLSTNYMAHLAVIRRRLVEQVGRLRPEMDGAQDWDLLLRVTERTDRVARIPEVLYHWRADETSAALLLETKPEAERRQRQVVEEHLARVGSTGTVARADDGQLRIAWGIHGSPTVSVIIPTKHNRALLERCLGSISRSSYESPEIIIVESATRTEERDNWYRGLGERFPHRLLWWDQPFNYSAVNNWAAGEATGEILVFLNDDTEVLADRWLEDLVGWLQRPGVGVVGAQLLTEEDTIQHGGVVVGLLGFADHLFRGLKPPAWTLLGSTDWYRNVSAVTGACLAIRRDLFDEIGRWDERFVLCGSDVELCLRVHRSGRRIVCIPSVQLRHIEAATRGTEIPEEDFGLSFWHYQSHLYGGDPYHNPNLSLAHPVPTFRELEDEPHLRVVSEVLGRDVEPRPPAAFDQQAASLAEICQVSAEDLEAVHRAHASTTGRRDVSSVNWLVPDFENPFYGGIHTIFRFADYFQRQHGVKNRFVVIGTGPEAFVRSGLAATFPEIADSEIQVVPGGRAPDMETVPMADAAVATLWVTAYALSRWRGADRMFYFLQDFEPMFYPAGALYALAEKTYRMGFYGIANTPPMEEVYRSYGGRTTGFLPCVDTEVFHNRRPVRDPDQPFTVFMYGRPGHPRNCYELAVAALRQLKDSLKDRVRIVTAGSWTGSEATAPWLDNLGLLDYRETAELYRRCDAGLVLSVSKHPTYIPLQLMACGALVIANDNPANGWLLQDGENCLLADLTVDALHQSLERGLLDPDLRTRLSAQAAANIQGRHSDWASEMERVYEFLSDPEGSR